jgi:nuclear-control-of-ATPase protein 2
MRNSLSLILTNADYEYFGTTEFLPKIQCFIEILNQRTGKDVDANHPSPIMALAHLSNETLPKLKKTHHQMLKANGLLRPGRWILMWPKVILFPPLALFACKSLYASRTTLEDVARDAVETLKGFVRGWLLDPLRDVLRTVRTGSTDAASVLVRKEGVLADLDVSYVLDSNASISLIKAELGTHDAFPGQR